MSLVSDKPILVTGATGFIATHIIEQLLVKGYKVRGTVRSVDKKKLEYLYKLDTKGDLLELVEADLIVEGSFDNHVKDVEYVLHVASPFMMDIKDAKKELIDPAVNGTLSILNACEKSGTVKKIVITSSVAAITDSPNPNKTYTEEDWNNESSLTRNPYYYSKKLAEETAWKYLKDKSPKFTINTINPTLVFGPGHKAVISESQKLIHDILIGNFPMIMNIHWSTVDVRDVAKCHILAMENEKASGRFICCNEAIHFKDMCTLISKNFKGYKVPTLDMSGWFGNKLMYLASYTQPTHVGTYLQTNLGMKYNMNNSKIKKELGIDFIPLEKSVVDMINFFIETKQLEKK